MVKESSNLAQAAGSTGSLAKKTGRSLESLLTYACRVLNIMGITVLMAMTLMTVMDVVGRLFKRPIVGSTEITEFMMVTVVFLCIGWCAIKGRMVTVDLIIMRLSAKTQAILNVITLIVGLGVVVLITWRSFLETMDVQEANVSTIILHIPSYPFMWILSFGFAVLCLVMIMQIVQNLVKVVGK